MLLASDQALNMHKSKLRIFLIALLVVTAQAGFSQTNDSSIPHLTLTFKTIDCAQGAIYTTATGINNAGQVVGDCAGLHGFRWTPNSIESIDFPSAANSRAADINSFGEIVGTYNSTIGSYSQGFQVNKGTYATIDATGAVQTVVIGINGAGATVGYWNDQNYNIYGFLYGNGTFTPISVPGSLGTTPKGLNSSTIVGSYVTSTALHGFLLQGGIFTALDFPGAIFSDAHSINASGKVIGIYEDSNFQYHGFLWEGGAFVATFDLRNQILQDDSFTRLSLNDKGQIVGTYPGAKGVHHGFIATLPKLN